MTTKMKKTASPDTQPSTESPESWNAGELPSPPGHELVPSEPILTSLACQTRQETRQQLMAAVRLMQDALRSSVITELTEVQADLRDSVLTDLAMRLAATEESLKKPTARILLPSIRKRVENLTGQLESLYVQMGMEPDLACQTARQVGQELVPSLPAAATPLSS